MKAEIGMIIFKADTRNILSKPQKLGERPGTDISPGSSK
jgi:hypothetical protein